MFNIYIFFIHGLRLDIQKRLTDRFYKNSGLVKSPATVCNEILIEAKKLASQLDRKQVTLRVNPEVAKALKERGNAILQEIEELTNKDVIVRNDPSLHMQSFDFH